MSALREWWAGREARERLLLGTGGAVVVAALFYVLVLEPLAERRLLLARQYAAERAQAVELARLASEATALRAAAPAATPDRSTNLIAALNDAIAAHDLKAGLKRLVPASEKEVQLAFEGVAFDKLLAFVITLHGSYGIEVLRINVERSGVPGVVNANLSLGRG